MKPFQLAPQPPLRGAYESGMKHKSPPPGDLGGFDELLNIINYEAFNEQ